ncbi:tat pathway signal sequence [Pseudomassariella vexata]|uniref:Tat pathway signal sequence n=1 Tax=Pseudomassariella vexata TaxID=1141098 RepID=A0A1Y2EIR9_9PEZI|nr:tat pathway signal sequence [Pseudomassariella vexata]ORY71450.1 tat pathway signal sequence [Pseudomassariella vexata]
MDFEKDEQSQPLAEHVDGFDDDCNTLASTSNSRQHNISHILSTSILFVIYVTISGFFGAYIGRRGGFVNSSLDSQCAAFSSSMSPVLTDVDIHYAMTPFNGSFMQETIHRRPHSPEVDAAWEALGVDYRAGVISRTSGLASGLTRRHVQRAEKYGGGFLVNVEGMHHLHCLNLLRKSLYFNFNYYKALGGHEFKNEDGIFQLHVTHCLDTIRQVLICNVDTGVLGQVWVHPDKPSAFPDFNTEHKCKNYDDVRKWAEVHQAPPLEELPPDYLASPQKSDVLVGIP